MGHVITDLPITDELRQWAERVYPLELVIADLDRERIDAMYPGAVKVGAALEIKAGPMQGHGRCIRRKLIDRGGILFTILLDDGRILDREWFD